MKKTFALKAAHKQPERVLDAVRHEINKFLKRERRKELPPGADFWDFDCRLGVDADSASTVHLGELNRSIDDLARSGAEQLHLEITARAAQRSGRTAKVLAQSLETPGAV